MPSIDPEELQAIRQALGLDRAARPYRNHYPAPPDDPVVQQLVRRGLMRAGPGAAGGQVLFLVTAAGARHAGATLPELGPER